MHCPVEEIQKDVKKEKDLDRQKMTAISEDYDRMNIMETLERAMSGKAGSPTGEAKPRDRTGRQTTKEPESHHSCKANVSDSARTATPPRTAGCQRLSNATPARNRAISKWHA